MSAKIEKEIQSDLKKGEPPANIAARLLKRKTIQTQTDHLLALTRFMYSAGLHKMLFQFTLQQLSKKQIVPWGGVIKILLQAKTDFSDRFRKQILKGIRKQNQLRQILTIRLWEEEILKLQEWKHTTREKIYRHNNQNLIKLMEDLQFIRSQGVLQKEEEILKQLKKIEPKNPAIQEEWLQFKDKQNRKILKQHKLQLLTMPMRSARADTKEQQTAKELFGRAIKILKTRPAIRQDIALLFSFIGYPDLAVKILQKHLSSPAEEWLYLDLLLQSKLYIKCLSVADYMEVRYKDNPETITALTYIRAIAYYHLGKREQAKTILAELAKVKPDYRLTRFLIEQWSKEDKK